MLQLPIVHIDQLAESLGITRDWINRRWLKSDNPPPHFRDGDAVFFPVDGLREWADRRSADAIN
ncbi:DNA-binding protein [Botrimarina mediterranea]|uniref:DNA-binding protein n=1 Tax=Botrimarina mediterranea TaxID=2528022 RepID=UPI00118C38DD|nr:hypothetical protein K2D_05810 [Planctomycetes bacterium K2D]